MEDIRDTWSGMKQRCLNSSNKDYHKYGGRGIGVCDRWKNSYSAFVSDMGKRPVGMTIERIDNNLGYSPKNCKWATPKEQAQNRRTTILITEYGVTLSIVEWANLLEIPRGRIDMRLRKGESNHDAIFRCGDANQYITKNKKIDKTIDKLRSQCEAVI